MSVPSWKRNSQLFAAITPTYSTVGVYVGDDGTGHAVVNVWDDAIHCGYGTRYRPPVGDPVILTWIGGVVKLMGPAAARSKTGVVTGVTPTLLGVQVDGRGYQLPYDVGYANSTPGPTVGDQVVIDWDVDGGAVISKLTAATTATLVIAKTTQDLKPFTVTFYATASGSYRSTDGALWTDDLYCADGFKAAWWFDHQVAETIPDDAIIDTAEIYLSLRVKGPPQPTLGLHGDPVPQGGGVSGSGAIVLQAWEGWTPIPTSWASGWRDNPGGVTIHGGSSIYRGIGTDRQSGKLRISGRQ